MSVPNQSNIKLSEVITELGLPSNSGLTACFAASSDGGFDPLYRGNKDRLSNFRNYSAIPLMTANNPILVATHLVNDTSVAKSQPFITADGTKMFIQQDKGNVESYTLTIPWDIDSNVYQGYLNEHTNNGGWHGAWYTPDGLSGFKIYSEGSTDKIVQNTYSAAWAMNLDTRFDELDIPGTIILRSMTFNADGTKFWVIDDYQNWLWEFKCTTAWNLKTAVEVTKLYIAPPISDATAIWWNGDGTRIFLATPDLREMINFAVEAPWSIVGMNIVAEHTSPYISELHSITGAFHIPNTSNIITTHGVSAYVREWDLSG